jgi:hypothetical protein
MLARNKLLALVLSAIFLVAIAWAAFAAAKAPVAADEPITMTKAMYADLLCIAASDFEPYKGGVQFTYDPASDTVKATSMPPTRNDGGKRSPLDMAYGKTVIQEQAEVRMKLVLPKIQRHVSPAATATFVGF